jgi:hypothetical protein
VGDGKFTSFWHDKWHQLGVLSLEFEALFAHCTRQNASVHSVVRNGLSLRPRLSAAAALELQHVSQILASLTLQNIADERVMAWGREGPFSSRAAYKMLAPVGTLDVSACIAWGSSLPTKLKVFSYLMSIDRLSTRGNLFYKNCAPTAVCASCPCEETSRHLFFDCVHAAGLWRTLGVLIPAGAVDIWNLHAPFQVSLLPWRASVAVILWNIWKARNDVVFNSARCSPAITIRRCCDDLTVWMYRFKNEERDDLARVRSFLMSAISSS